MRTITLRGAVALVAFVALAAIVALAAPAMAGSGCCKAPPEAKAGGTKEKVVVEATSEDVAALVSGTNDFAFDLYGRLAGDGNLFFSPYSISTALAMTAMGARGNTEQRDGERSSPPAGR